jgi:DNA-directed RNA polymerase specialized sigma24 family protein
MQASVLSVWRRDHDVIAGVDPWDIVDEAWASMAEKNFECEGPFLPFALRVAKNKTIDTLRSAEVWRRDASLDAPLPSHADDAEETTLHDVEGPYAGAGLGKTKM